MIELDDYLRLKRCPHCKVDVPNLLRVHKLDTIDSERINERTWGVYVCGRCGGIVTAWSYSDESQVRESFPSVQTLDNNIPERVYIYLQQAIDTVFAPSGSVMLCASAVDEMLKEKGYKKGSLYARIEDAQKAGVLTKDMTKWAHQVRLDANDQRHADQSASLPTEDDARLLIEFTKTLADFLFVLPAKVTRGIAASTATP